MDIIKCKYCSLEFPTKSPLKKHLKYTHLEYRFQCPYCTSTLSTQRNLNYHINVIHHKVTCRTADGGYLIGAYPQYNITK